MTMNSPQGPRSFPVTHWSLVQRAFENGDRNASRALAEICEAYWYPIYAFVRRKGYGVEDAEDLTQGFFARLLRKDILAAADRDKGRLRTFLLTCLRRFLADERDKKFARKRGAAVTFSLDAQWAEQRYASEPVSAELSADRLYQRRWAINLLEFSLEQIATDYADRGKGELFAALRPYLGVGEASEEPYETVASRLDMPVGTLKSHVSRLRQRWREILFEQVAITLEDPTSDNIKEELAELQDWL